MIDILNEKKATINLHQKPNDPIRFVATDVTVDDVTYTLPITIEFDGCDDLLDVIKCTVRDLCKLYGFPYDPFGSSEASMSISASGKTAGVYYVNPTFSRYTDILRMIAKEYKWPIKQDEENAQ